MKTFKRTSLPEEIKYNGERYTHNATISGAMTASNTSPQKTIEAVKSTCKKAVLVEVLSRNLRRRTDLHGQPYKPSQFIFTT